MLHVHIASLLIYWIVSGERYNCHVASDDEKQHHISKRYNAQVNSVCYEKPVVMNTL